MKKYYNTLNKEEKQKIKEKCHKYVDSSNFENIVSKAKNKNNSKTILINQLKQLKIKERQISLYIDKIYEDKLSGVIDIDMYNRNSIKYKNELNEITNQIDKIEKKILRITPKSKQKEKEEIILKINEYLNFDNPNRVLISNIVDKILLSQDKTVEIHYKFKYLN